MLRRRGARGWQERRAAGQTGDGAHVDHDHIVDLGEALLVVPAVLLGRIALVLRRHLEDGKRNKRQREGRERRRERRERERQRGQEETAAHMHAKIQLEFGWIFVTAGPAAAGCPCDAPAALLRPTVQCTRQHPSPAVGLHSRLAQEAERASGGDDGDERRGCSRHPISHLSLSPSRFLSPSADPAQSVTILQQRLMPIGPNLSQRTAYAAESDRYSVPHVSQGISPAAFPRTPSRAVCCPCFSSSPQTSQFPPPKHIPPGRAKRAPGVETSGARQAESVAGGRTPTVAVDPVTPPSPFPLPPSPPLFLLRRPFK